MGALTYQTNCGFWHPFTRVFNPHKATGRGSFTPAFDDQIRVTSESVLPPVRAAPPRLSTRRGRPNARGMLETLTLVALSDGRGGTSTQLRGLATEIKHALVRMFLFMSYDPCDSIYCRVLHACESLNNTSPSDSRV